MITALTLGGYPITTTQVLLQSFNNGSFPATVYTKSKRGGFQGSKMPTPTFASYQLVINLAVIGLSFADLVAQRQALFKILGLVHSLGSQTLIITRSDGISLQIDIKTIEVTGDMTTEDGTLSNVQITLNAEYPFMMSSIASTTDVHLYNGGGMSVPMGVPLDLTHNAQTAVSIQNNGNYNAYPTFTFIGPLHNPSITNQATGEALSLACTLADETESVVVDCYNRTVTMMPSGNVGRQYASGVFWTVPIGPSNIIIGSSSGGDTGKCVLTFRDTYLGV